MLLVNGGFPISVACFGEIMLFCGLSRVSISAVTTILIGAAIITLSGLYFWVLLCSGRNSRMGYSTSCSDQTDIGSLGCAIGGLI